MSEVVRVADSPALRREEKRRRKRLPSEASEGGEVGGGKPACFLCRTMGVVAVKRMLAQQQL